MGIHYQLDFPDDPPVLKISGEQRRNILLVTKEALNNAVKYAEASVIRISCVCTNDKLSFKVEDDGKGFDTEHAKEHGNGLKNMKRRMEHIGGHFSVGHPAKGTSIEYSIPV
jgi:signal transduction histidine kinase